MTHDSEPVESIMSLVWFITGVSSGLGLQIGLQALKHGHKVIGTVRSRQRAAQSVEEFESKGGKVCWQINPSEDLL